MSNDNKNVNEFRERTSTQITATVSSVPVEEMTEQYTNFPNAWSRVRYQFREAFAEFFGTMVLVLFGNGVLCQVNSLLHRPGRHRFDHLNFQVVLSSNSNVASTPKGVRSSFPEIAHTL